MKGSANEHIAEALGLACKLTILADEGDYQCSDDGCAVLYGVLRDCAYKIRAEAERECREHKAKGLWQEQAGPDG